MRAAGGMGADHDFPPGPVSRGELFDGVFDNLDMIGIRVGAGNAGPQQGRQRLTGAQNPVVKEGHNR